MLRHRLFSTFVELDLPCPAGDLVEAMLQIGGHEVFKALHEPGKLVERAADIAEKLLEVYHRRAGALDSSRPFGSAGWTVVGSFDIGGHRHTAQDLLDWAEKDAGRLEAHQKALGT